MQTMINTLLDPIVNFGKMTVSTGYTNVDTVITLTAGHGSKLPNPSSPDYRLYISRLQLLKTH